MFALFQNPAIARFLNGWERIGTLCLKLGVKGSQVQILSARPRKTPELRGNRRTGAFLFFAPKHCTTHLYPNAIDLKPLKVRRVRHVCWSR